MTNMTIKAWRVLRWLSVFVLLAAAAVGWSRAQAALSGGSSWEGELSIGEVGARLGPSLPWLLGMEGPRTYLVLVQNRDELRATGGFIAAVGRVSVDGGRLTDFDFEDSYALYSDRSTYPPAPQAMQQFMGIPLLVMRDANWSPDFPTTAQVARALYAQETGTQVDGVFTVDLNAVKRLIGALGALDVPGADEPITSDNIEQQVIRFWEKPVGASTSIAAGMNIDWFGQRKDFIPAIAREALNRIQGGNVNYGALLTAVQSAMDERSIQIWVNNPQVQSVMAEARWDGGLHPQPGADFLALIDTNMGYNKVDAAIERSLAYSVTWPEGPDQPALATVTISYTHPITTPDPGCDQSPRYGTSYADMIARCYFDYVRVFAPAGSELVKAKGVEGESIISRRGERGTHEFAGFFVLPPASEQQVSFTYRLPAGITPDNYRLLFQRQSGTQPLPLTLDVDGAAQATTVAEGWLDWSAPPRRVTSG
jgi:hypothetical protein